MANPVLLSNEQHKDIKIITDRSAEYGDNVHLIPVLATEISALMLDYPVCFTKDSETGQFQLQAFTGFEPGENLFLTESGWNASYVPAHIRRQPFMVGFSSKDENDENPSPMISMDLDNSRVSTMKGEALFDSEGNRTPFLENIEKLLVEILRGNDLTQMFVKSLTESDLIEPIKLDVEFADGNKKSYQGVYTVNAQKLSELKGEALEALNANGMLQICYQMAGSIGHVRKLVNWKNASF